MTTTTVKELIELKNIAVVGVSRGGKNFGNKIFKDMAEKGFNMYAVNSNGGEWDGVTLYTGLDTLPDPVDAVITVVPPEVTEQIVRQAHDLGINYIWMQVGSESSDAIRFCEENDIHYIANQCILMYAPPVTGAHKVHSWLWKLFGKYEK